MSQRKHFSELALSFYSDGMILLHPKDIATIDDCPSKTVQLAKRCHIYLIATRPRLSFVPGSIFVGGGKTSGMFRYFKEGVAIEVGFWFQGEAKADLIQISEYPHTKLSLINDGEAFFSATALLLSMRCDHIDDLSIRDLEVIYVGMSYAGGSRSAKDRLHSHSTLQRVLADLNNGAPDKEALIIMAEYSAPQTIISFDGRDKSLKLEDDRDVMAVLGTQYSEITEDLQIALIEAGLIKYFQPPYNDKYKERFPHPTHKILKKIYSIDFGGLVIELNTQQINAQVHSVTREAGYHHIASFDLHDPETRRSLFNVMNLPSGSNAADHSGPFF